ncbi:MAG: AAA family ATPase, partial [Bacteroidales bacterium]
MILELKVKNFFSIKEEQVLSFEATSDNTLEDYYVVEKGQKRVLKLAIIYGPNASGKTNMLKALSFLRSFALKKGVDKSSPTEHIPFLLSEKTATENGVFNLSFYAGDMLYSYSLELNNQYVVKESLHYYPSQKPALVFKRLYDESKKLTVIKIPKAFKLNAASVELLQVSTIPNISVIAAYSGLNIDFPQLEEAYQFFRKKITDTVYPNTELTKWTSDRVNSLPETKDFAVSFLRNADFNILDIKVNEIEMPTNRIKEVITASDLSPEKKEELLQKETVKVNRIGFSHAVKGGASVDFPMELESAGTSRFYGLSGVLQFVLTNNSCLSVDEIESS